MEGADRPDRAPLSQDQLLGWAAALPDDNHAADSSAAAVVRPQRSGDGGCADRGADDAPIRRDRHDQRPDPR